MQNDLEKYFQKSDLIPAVIQEHGTGQVLMLAYMNRESLKKRWKPAILGFGPEAGRSFGIRAPQAVIFKRSFPYTAIVMMIPS